MAGTNDFDILNKKCYKCNRYIKHQAMRIETAWFCAACWYHLTDAQKYLIRTDLQERDWDLERKENLIDD